MQPPRQTRAATGPWTGSPLPTARALAPLVGPLVFGSLVDVEERAIALEALVSEEVEVVMSRLAGEVEAERVAEMLEAGAEPLKDLIAAMHTKLLVAELERRRGA